MPGWILVVLAVVAAAGLGWGLFLARGVRQGPVRNVLLVVLDTTRADRCSLYGHWRETTPYLDRLARESIVFDDAWSPAPWTVPAHGALFTGRPPWEIGLLARDFEPISPSIPTLAKLLGAKGFATLCVTANPWLSNVSGLHRDFQAYVPTFGPQGDGPTPENHVRALAWMREQRAARRPFFAFINDMDPHAPYAPPGEFGTKFVPSDLAVEKVREARAMKPSRSFALSLGIEPLDGELRRAIGALYDGEVAALDAEIGRLLETMRAEGLLDGTLVVLVGDHGEGLADHGWIEHSFRLDREVLRVPLLVRLPGPGTGGGTRVKDVVEIQDVFPTILEFCGVPLPPGVPAQSLLAPSPGRVARAKGVASADLREAAAMYTSHEATRALNRMRTSVFDGRLHLVTEEGAPPRLFDVTKDPGEEHDLSKDRPDDLDQLTRLLPR